MAQVEVIGIRVEFPSNQPVLILRELNSARFLPLWIGVTEADAISMSLDEIEVPRPLTHDLTLDVIENLGERLQSVEITELVDGVFYAVLNFVSHDSISARPSDAVALAVRAQVPIFVADEVLAEAGQLISEDAEISDDEGSSDEVEQFREFLEQINPEDFS